MQLLGCSLQYRIKSGVLILFTGIQGTGKTAVYGCNESGPGVYMCIYGDCGMQYNNTEALLKDFNADAMGKLYRLLEEANPGNNTRNNNQRKDIITGGRQRIERIPSMLTTAAHSPRARRTCRSRSSKETAGSS